MGSSLMEDFASAKSERSGATKKWIENLSHSMECFFPTWPIKEDRDPFENARKQWFSEDSLLQGSVKSYPLQYQDPKRKDLREQVGDLKKEKSLSDPIKKLHEKRRDLGLESRGVDPCVLFFVFCKSDERIFEDGK